MLVFKVHYTYDDPTPEHPKAFIKGAADIEAEDADDARFRFTGKKSLKNVRNLQILSVEEA